MCFFVFNKPLFIQVDEHSSVKASCLLINQQSHKISIKTVSVSAVCHVEICSIGGIIDLLLYTTLVIPHKDHVTRLGSVVGPFIH